MDIKYEEIFERQVQDLHSFLERIHHSRQDDEEFIRQRAVESVNEYYRVVGIFDEEVALSYSKSVLYDGLFYND